MVYKNANVSSFEGKIQYLNHTNLNMVLSMNNCKRDTNNMIHNHVII